MTNWLAEFERTDVALSSNSVPRRAAPVRPVLEARSAGGDAAAAPAALSTEVRQNAETAECCREASAAIAEFVRIVLSAAAPDSLCFDPLHRSAAIVEACAEEDAQSVSLPGALPHHAMAWMQGLAAGGALALPVGVVLADLTEEEEPGQSLRQLLEGAGRLMTEGGVLAVLVTDATLAIALRAVGGEVRVRALAEEGYGCLLLDLPGVATHPDIVQPPYHQQQQHERADNMIGGEQAAEQEEAAAMAPPGRSTTTGTKGSQSLPPKKNAVRHHYFDRQQLDRYGTNGIASTLAARDRHGPLDIVVSEDPTLQSSQHQPEPLPDDPAALPVERLAELAQKTVRQIGRKYVVRRLTPMECMNLQGFPPDHCMVPITTKRRRKLSKAEAAELIALHAAEGRHYTTEQLESFPSDAEQYACAGNSIAVVCLDFLMGNVARHAAHLFSTPANDAAPSWPQRIEDGMQAGMDTVAAITRCLDEDRNAAVTASNDDGCVPDDLGIVRSGLGCTAERAQELLDLLGGR
ncbi:MAG: hypothetical protein VR70_12250 [Rhodospirillaceae bacterium BRH_c57]|nr:MAG: hypothetical protein VR70_12250 [Rhodospirillaceae bacterium BRH_c57]